MLVMLLVLVLLLVLLLLLLLLVSALLRHRRMRTETHTQTHMHTQRQRQTHPPSVPATRPRKNSFIHQASSNPQVASLRRHLIAGWAVARMDRANEAIFSSPDSSGCLGEVCALRNGHRGTLSFTNMYDRDSKTTHACYHRALSL